MGGPVWTDSHCHLQDEADPEGAWAAARAAGVERLVCVGTNAAWSRRALELADRLGPGVYATVGLHPHEASAGTSEVAAMVGELAGDPRLVGVGECGLDYHYDNSPRPEQRRAFAEQVVLAAHHRLTLVIHTREAWADTFGVLQAEGVPERTVFHCFTGGPDEARRCLDLGAYLSFSGIASFASAGDVREAAKLCPADRLLLETDSPFLTPAPHRGRPNTPAYLPLVGRAVAAARGEAPEVLAETSSGAAAQAFGLQGARDS